MGETWKTLASNVIAIACGPLFYVLIQLIPLEPVYSAGYPGWTAVLWTVTYSMEAFVVGVWGGTVYYELLGLVFHWNDFRGPWFGGLCFSVSVVALQAVMLSLLPFPYPMQGLMGALPFAPAVCLGIYVSKIRPLVRKQGRRGVDVPQKPALTIAESPFTDTIVMSSNVKVLGMLLMLALYYLVVLIFLWVCSACADFVITVHT